MSVNPADPLPHGLRSGDLLGGRFRIVRFLGAGGMGEVYEAADEELGGTVAVKTIRADRLERSTDFLDRFREEAKLARRVTHPNICRIFDVGRDADRIFFTMEFVDGETLAGLLRRCGRVTIEAALPLVRQMAAGLEALHQQGIVHRDFKTSNVLIAESSTGVQRAVITDFGLARPQEETMTLDAQGIPHIMGTPDYMAPEQLTGKSVTTATDVYAFGLVMYEMVAGRRPYPGGRALENAVQRLGEAPPPPSNHAEGIPRRWDRVILRCLERDPAARPSSASEVIALLTGEGELPARRRVWIPAAAALAVLGAGIAVWSSAGRTGKPPNTGAGGAHATYLRAQDALDHYYRPHGLEDAVRLFDETVRQDPGFALAYAGLARANFQQYWQMRDTKYIEPARANAEKALSLDSKLASVHVTLGRLYTETGKNDLAAQELNEALRLDPRDAEAYYARATLYDKQGRTADVEPAYQEAIDLAPGDWRFPDNLADYYLRTGNFDKALEWSTKAVGLTPDNPRALNNLGRAYWRVGRLGEARAAYEKANQIEPGYSRYANLGVILEDEGKPQEAAASYRKALDLNSASYNVWGNLGSALAAIPGREGEAREAYQQAVLLAEKLRQTKPNDPELLSLLARYYAYLGSEGKSSPLLRQATALAPGDPQILFRAAITCEMLKQRAQALKWTEKALSHGLMPAAVEREFSMAALRKDPGFTKLVNQYKRKG